MALRAWLFSRLSRLGLNDSYQGGINETFSAPRGIVEFVPLDINANRTQPRRLVTSGLGGIFPPGLLIGSIITLEPGSKINLI